MAKGQQDNPFAGRPLTVAGFAHLASEGQWACAPHLDLINRKLTELAVSHIRRLIITVPPRHGKSFICSQYFPAWYVGSFPDRRFILAAYNDDFAAEWGRKARDIVMQHGGPVFGVSINRDTTAASRWEINGRAGGMSTAGVGGGLLGKGFNCAVIDDPYKNAEEAFSETTRSAVWNWFLSTFLTRQEPGSSVVVLMQRWHEDDLIGRILTQQAELREAGGLDPALQWHVVNMPAVCETQDDRDEFAEQHGLPLGVPDPLGREPGQALWPARYDERALAAIKASTEPYLWEAQYQQRPRPAGGNIFKGAWFQPCEAVPDGSTWCRYWDRAGTEAGGDYSAGVLMAKSPEGKYFVADAVRFRHSAAMRDALVRETAARDSAMVASKHGVYMIRGEQEPGSGGKDAALAFVKMLAGFDVKAATVTGDKESRARPLASQAEIGNVSIVQGAWNKPFLNELESFPRGKHDDQVDAASGAFNALAGSTPGTWGTSPFGGYRGRTAR